MQENKIPVHVFFKEDIFEQIQLNATQKDSSVENYIENIVEEEVTIVKLSDGFKYKLKEKQLISISEEKDTFWE